MSILAITYTQVHIWPMVIAAAFMGISWLVGSRLKSKFAKYSKTSLQSGLSGKEIAEKMLADHGLHDVKIISVPGKLTDHYNPRDRSVNLSPEVYNGRNAAAAAVSAHECGHAVQHATAYAFLGFRSKMVPVLSLVSRVMPFLVLGLSVLSGIAYGQNAINTILYIIIAGNGALALFSLVTLPVEFDASKRALAWIEKTGVVTKSEYAMSKDALKWAAMTYLVAALAAVSQVIYWIFVLLNSQRD